VSLTSPCAQDYADVVTRCLERAAEHVQNAGETLIKAKKKLDHGDWLRMFKDHPEAVDRPIPFGARTGQMLMKIASHPVLSEANHGSRLPRSWRTLYELTKFPEAMLRQALADGRVHPGMERSHVKRLRVELTPRVARVVGSGAVVDQQPVESRAPAPIWDYDGARQRLTTAVQAELTHCPDDALSELADLLGELRQQVLDANRVAEAAHAEAADVAPAEFRCSSCERQLTEGEVVEVRECSREACAARFDGSGGRNCTECNSPFTRLLTEQGCPDCLEEDSVEVVEAAREALA
jgi:hypothetical protein